MTFHAQKAPIKWGKTTAEERSMIIYEADSSANAVVLCDYGEIVFDLGEESPFYRFTRHKRVKILKRAGFDEGDLAISYFSKKPNMSLKAQVIQPDGSIVKVSKGDIFHEEVQDNYYRKNLAFPNLEEGSIIEYTYTYNSPYLTSLREWYFQDDIPTVKSELRVSMPIWFYYTKLFQGQSLLTSVEENSKMLNTRLGQVEANSSRYIAENMPALKEESFVTTMYDYLARIKFQLKAIEIPGVMYETYMTNWGDVEQELLTNTHFGGQFLKKKWFKEIAETVAPQLTACKTNEAKIELLYNYVVNTMEWDGEYALFCDRDMKKILASKKGSSAELNLMFLGLMRYFELEAYPVLVSTRKHGRVQQHYPFLNQFNHVVVYAQVDEKSGMLMDALDNNMPLGYLNVASLNKAGLLIGAPTGYQWIGIQARKSKDAMVATLQLAEDGTLSGDIQCRHSGYSAIYERDKLATDTDASFWSERFEDRSIAASISDASYSNVKEIGEPLKGKFKCEFSEAAIVADDYIYLNPIVYSGFDENPFKLEERTYPIEIPYPIEENLVLSIEIPEGYVVDELPEALNLGLPNQGGNFTYSFKQTGDNKLQIMARTTLNQLYFAPEEYATIKNFFDIILEKLNEQLVLRKA